MPMGDPMMAMPPGGAPPQEPGMQQMVDQQMMQQMIETAVQKALGGGEGGVAAGQKKGNKIEEATATLREEMKEQTKIFVAALRNAGIEIPLADLYGIEKADGSGPDGGLRAASQAAGGQPSAPGLSETMNTGLGGVAGDGQPGKVAEFKQAETQIDMLKKLAHAKDALNRSALGHRLNRSFDPQAVDMKYFQGLWS
jgi:hypothetical protein